jgi:tRNA (guanine6-N2)-methyltransferase
MPRRERDIRARRGEARATRERESLRASRYAQRREREGRPITPSAPVSPKLPPAAEYEAEVVPGLEPFAIDELRRILGARLKVPAGLQRGTLCFQTRADAGVLLDLGTVSNLYRVQRLDVPRPRALLGEEHLQSLIRQIRPILALHSPGSFQSFRFSAAGVTSSVFARLSEALERRTGLRNDPEEGDLLIRVRRASVPRSRPPSDAEAVGFELLFRLSPRPLSVRPWRVCNLPGALNATVARVMAHLTSPAPHDRFVNLICGSGTLMIERLALGTARLMIGGDRDLEALACARSNLRTAGVERKAVLLRWDAGRLPIAGACANVLCADLPYGMLMGSRRENERLYPALLAEATRVAAPGAVMALITQASPLLRTALDARRREWSLERSFEVEISFKSGVLRPRIFLLRRSRLH